MIVQQPAIGFKLSQNFGSLIAQMQDYLVQRLAQTPELSNLPRHTLQAVADQLQPRRLAEGQYCIVPATIPPAFFSSRAGALKSSRTPQMASARRPLMAGCWARWR